MTKANILSITENIKTLKEGLNSEEKIFETVVNLEKIYKRYKLIIWTLVVAVVAYFIISAVNASVEETRVATANSAYAKLLENKDDATAKTMLKENSPALYDLYTFHEAMTHADIDGLKALRDSKTFAISDMASYQYAMLSGDNKALMNYINNGGIYYKDIALLNAASTLLKQSKIKEAKALLDRIQQDSAFYDQAQTLKHYGVAK